ncbi:helix-turn-helix domain-containing protein [Arcanobacterium hippocoleae]
MPKISAATVKEHHAQMFLKLADAAEVILRERGPNALTAGSVAEAAGIARNSIYRYVSSIDDLRMVVLERYLPLWVQTVEKRVNRDDEPRKQLLDLAIVSLEMAQTTGHSWLISVMRHRGECAEKILMRQVRMHRTTGKARQTMLR